MTLQHAAEIYPTLPRKIARGSCLSVSIDASMDAHDVPLETYMQMGNLFKEGDVEAFGQARTALIDEAFEWSAVNNLGITGFNDVLTVENDPFSTDGELHELECAAERHEWLRSYIRQVSGSRVEQEKAAGSSDNTIERVARLVVQQAATYVVLDNIYTAGLSAIHVTENPINDTDHLRAFKRVGSDSYCLIDSAQTKKGSSPELKVYGPYSLATFCGINGIKNKLYKNDAILSHTGVEEYDENGTPTDWQLPAFHILPPEK